MPQLLPLNGLMKAVLPAALERETPNLTPLQGRPIWQPTPSGFGNPWLRVPQAQNLRMYEQLVETIPILNRAIVLIAQLVGHPQVKAADDTKAEIEDWLNRLVVNRIQTGFASWFPVFIKDALLYGRSHAELVLLANRRDIYAIQELHPRTIELRPNADGFGIDLVQIQIGSGQPVILNPKRILTMVHDVRSDSPQGNSILMGLPFVAEIMTGMLKDMKQTFERFGTPSYHIRYLPPKELSDPKGLISASFLNPIMARWNQLMTNRANGDIGDFGTAGDVEVRVVGAAGETLEFVAPLREIISQLISKTGIPPFLFGMQWQTTETMSTVEAGLLTEMIEELRASVGPEINYLVKTRQQLAGRDDQFKICWEAPTLIDAFETARAKLLDAQADTIRLKNDERLWKLGILNVQDLARHFREDLEDATDEEIAAELPDLLPEPPEPPALPAFGGGGNANGNGNGGNAQQGGLGGMQGLTYPRRLPAKNGRGH